MPLNDTDFNLGIQQSHFAPTPFSDLQNAVIGVEATAYLQHLIDDGPAYEPLHAALGGDPIGLKFHIENDLDKWQENGLLPFFVFDGQSVVGKDEMTLRNVRDALSKTEQAWNLYCDHKPNDAVKAFGGSGAIRVQELYRVLQEVLDERDMSFQIAPFSACAQLVYLLGLKNESENAFVDGLMGSNELLLYDKSAEAVVIVPPTAEDWENKTFRGIFRSELVEKLGVTCDMLDDALLMAGTSFLPTFPPLQIESIISQQPFTLVDAINLLRTSEKSVTRTCGQFSDILDKRDPKWLDKFRKAKMAVKHAIIVKENGQVISRDNDNLTSDNNDYLGLQLPPELYHYLSKALIGPRIMNYFISLESIVFPTLDGIVSAEYKRLVTQSLIPLKEMTAALVASRIHRVFQNKPVTMKFWFDSDLKQTLVHKSILEQPNAKADTWGVRDAELTSLEQATGSKAGTLSFAVLSLQEKGISAKTRSTEKISGLKSKSEVISNTLYRLLHLRGYVNDQHELTAWGRALAVTLKRIGATIKAYHNIHRIEDAAFLAFELVRFDNLNSRDRHPDLIGGPLRGSEDDKDNCILIGRTACLLKLRHHNLGYTGPLSKNFLAYNSLIKAIQETDRDLVEAVITSMFLSGQISRQQPHNYGDLGRSLPFSKAVNTIFGIAVTTYLDDFVKLEWDDEQRKAEKPNYAAKFVPHSTHFAEDLDVAFKFFDALYEGVKTLGDEITTSDKQAWDGAMTFLNKRR